MRIQGLGFRVLGLRFRVQGSGFRVHGAGSRVQGVGVISTVSGGSWGRGRGLLGRGLGVEGHSRLSVVRCRANLAHARLSRPDSGLGFRAKKLKTLKVFPSRSSMVLKLEEDQTRGWFGHLRPNSTGRCLEHANK